MKKLYLASTSAGVALILATASVAFAAQGGMQGDGNADMNVGVGGNGLQMQATVQTSASVQGSSQEEGSEGNQEREREQSQTQIHANATGTMMQAQQQNQQMNGQGSTSDNGIGEMHAEATAEQHQNQGDEHRNVVANIVQNLLRVANDDGGIGAEVRTVAQQQASTSEATAQAMSSLESEGGAKVFFLGPDYKSLGDLRSSIVTTQNDIQHLIQLRAQASASVQTQLNAQIQALQAEASSTQAYMDAHANAFSLFGWFVRLFNK